MMKGHINDYIIVKGAKENNLRNVNVKIPRNKLVVFSGVSGSGKSSLAFDTIYAEGRRRYMESLSSYARQFLESHHKPEVESIIGISPAIAIDQKTNARNPRSTVATATEVYDYMRVLFARVGVPHSPLTNKPIEKQTPETIIEKISNLPKGTKVNVFASIVKNLKGDFRRELNQLRKQNVEKVRIDGKFYSFEDLPIIDRRQKHNIDALIVSPVIGDVDGTELKYQILNAMKQGNGIISVEVIKLPEDYASENVQIGDKFSFSERFACPDSGFEIGEIEPRLFSFNNAFGACPKCNGIGKEHFFDPELIVVNPALSIKDGAITTWVLDDTAENNVTSLKETRFHIQTLESLAKHYNFDLNTPFRRLPDQIKDIIFYGSKNEEIKFIYNDGFRNTSVIKPFEGVITYLENKEKDQNTAHVSEWLGKFQSVRDCSLCNGFRLRKEALCVKIANKNIGEVSELTVEDAIKWFTNLPKELNPSQTQIAQQIIEEILERLDTISNVGLQYLSLSRKSHTLSGGENQRIKLATQIGSSLTGILYVLDEPSIGLHQSDNDRLLQMLKNLRDLGNTIIVVEHDSDTIKAADYLIDVGPGAGCHGGEIIAEGTPEEVSKNSKSITGQYLSGALKIEKINDRRPVDVGRMIKVKGASSYNLKNIDVDVPLGLFVAVTGVSGSGKSTFMVHTLYKAAVRKLNGANVIPGTYQSITGLEYVDKIIEVNQSPIGRTPRSNPATYISAFTSIRDWYASLPEAKSRGYNAGRFSFNVRGGRCETCEGDGMIKVEMHFLPDVYIECEQCKGLRYNNETLEIKYNGKSIADVLNMTTDEAVEFFKGMDGIYEKLSALQEVGLGYMKIGQSATTLSGGEAQRIKLAKELSRKSTGNTLYMLDEPTTGLHSHDIQKLLRVLHKLVDNGNTVIVIEHNLDVIKNADHIIDIGPQGGVHGGQVVVCGTPEEVAKCKTSLTGRYLKDYV